MKIFYPIIVLVSLMVINTVAQTTQTVRTSKIKASLGLVKPSMLGSSQRTEDCDTFSNLCPDDSLVVYSTAAGGYVAGQNGYGDISKADVFKLPGTTIKGVMLFFGVGTAVDTVNQFKVRIWDNDSLFADGSTGAPGTVLAETLVKYNDVKNDVANGDMTYVEFDPDVTMPADSTFYAGINFGYNAGDTIALVTTMERTGFSCDGKLTAFEEWSPDYYGGGWYSYETWGFTGVSHAIYPVTCDDVCNGGTTVYADNDGDGFGDISNGIFAVDCIAPDGYAYDSTDCDDANSEINPGVSEIINGLDDNCNGVIDEIVCNAPTGLETKDLTATSVKFKWGYSAASYKLRYKVATSGSWTLLGPTGQTKTVEGLLANTKYVWQVKSVCNVDPKIISEWSAKQFFTTAPFKVSTETEIPSLEVYPNPFSNSATISFSLPEATHAYIELFDLAGRKLQTIVDKDLSSGNHEVIFQRGQLSSGLYLLEVKLGEQVEVRKLVVE